MMDAGRSHKRLRRITRSCYQCRKRKVKCQLTDEDVETCAECVKSGTQCTIQPPEAGSICGSFPAHVDTQEHESRLERIESLLKRLVEAQERSRPLVEGTSGSEPAQPAALWDEFLLHSSADCNLPLIEDQGLAMSQSPNIRELDAKQSLVSLLPSTRNAATIVTNTTAWLWGAENPPGSVLKVSDTSRLLEISAISRDSEIHIAKALLLFALYMQQLPADFDVQFLESQDIENAIKIIVQRVKLFTITYEEEIFSLDGIECLTLLSLIPLNEGAIRKAWISFRRTLDVARLQGLQNSFSPSARNSTCSEVGLRRRLWRSTVCGDCYCSLLLGLEPGLGLAPFGPDENSWKDPFAEDDANFQRRICLIVARVAQRNTLGLHQDRQILREIEEALDRLQNSLPSAWWRAPSFSQDRPLDSAKDPDRLICQLWFFQARMFAHMPFAFGNSINDSQTSLEICSESSRITLHRYLGLQHARDQLSRCRSVDQSAFVAAIVLLLAKAQLCGQNGHSTISPPYDSDRAILERVIDSFESVGKIGHREHVAREIHDILSAMLRILIEGSEAFCAKPTSALGTPVQMDGEGALGTIKSGMQDIIVSSILPALNVHSPASRLINLFFATKRSASEGPKHTQERLHRHAGCTIDDFVDPTILQDFL